MVQEEDAQPLTEPIIAPVKVRKWTVEEKDMPETRFDKGYVVFASDQPRRVFCSEWRLTFFLSLDSC